MWSLLNIVLFLSYVTGALALSGWPDGLVSPRRASQPPIVRESRGLYLISPDEPMSVFIEGNTPSQLLRTADTARAGRRRQQIPAAPASEQRTLQLENLIEDAIQAQPLIVWGAGRRRQQVPTPAPVVEQETIQLDGIREDEVPAIMEQLDDPVVRAESHRTSSLPYSCYYKLPSSLRFTEQLLGSIKSESIILFSGGDSLERRQSGFAKLSAQSIERFAKHQGYQNIFLDQLSYDRRLIHGSVRYTPHWHRVFALKALRAKFPQAKYFVWLDDDILVPYHDTDMLNHYVNLMEKDLGWHMLYASEGHDFVLNSGMFFMKNTDLAFDTYDKALEIGVQRNGFLARNFGHEQGAIIMARERMNLKEAIKIFPHRSGPYNFNTFARVASWDPPDAVSAYGDAFVHFLSKPHGEREAGMNVIIREVQEWRQAVPQTCRYPRALKQ